ncbi:MAG: tetratricopeptide repeat protein [Candidatus Muirbacterium halophilum]|nr:tetratricopeptide repeat protein [Candidatus Muirbacterium halophilum]MCK9477122.1 tetratricopeptide repeat protein [Candidatus Muirbacterium halophilum]
MAFVNVFNNLIDNMDSAETILSIAKKKDDSKDSAGSETEFIMGKQDLTSGDVRNAYLHFKKSLLLNNKHVNSYLYIARLFNEKGNFKECRTLLENIVKIIPSLAFFNELALIYEQRGYESRLIDVWKEYIRKFPDSDKGYLNLGNYYRKKGQINKAVFYYEKILSLKTTNLSVKLELAEIYFSEKNFDKAIEILVEIYKESFNSGAKIEAGQKLVGVYLETGDIKKAYDIAENLYSSCKDEKFLLKTVDVHILSKKIEKANEICLRIRKVFPLCYQVYYRIAMIALINADIDMFKKNIRIIINFIDSGGLKEFLEKEDFEDFKEDFILNYSEISDISPEIIKQTLFEDNVQEQDEIFIEEPDDNSCNIDVAVELLFNLNDFFRKNIFKQTKLINAISSLIQKTNNDNVERLEKIHFFIDNNLMFFKTKKTDDKDEFRKSLVHTVSNLKKGIDFTSRTNQKIYEKINDFRKKNIEIQSELEKMLYDINIINRNYDNSKDFEDFIKSLESVFEK